MARNVQDHIVKHQTITLTLIALLMLLISIAHAAAIEQDPIQQASANNVKNCLAECTYGLEELVPLEIGGNPAESAIELEKNTSTRAVNPEVTPPSIKTRRRKVKRSPPQ